MLTCVRVGFSLIHRCRVVHDVVHHSIVVACATLYVTFTDGGRVDVPVLLVDVMNCMSVVRVVLNNCVAELVLLHISS